MNVITLPATATTPLIEFRPAERELAIQGECFPENPVPFFEPVLSTLRRYFTEQRPQAFDVRLRLQYVNSASTKAFRHLFCLLDEAGRAGAQVNLAWEFDAEDDALEELGLDLADGLNYLDVQHHALEPA
jgi:hypothetical protein